MGTVFYFCETGPALAKSNSYRGMRWQGFLNPAVRRHRKATFLQRNKAG
jgi:hypothetical protein